MNIKSVKITFSVFLACLLILLISPVSKPHAQSTQENILNTGLGNLYFPCKTASANVKTYLEGKPNSGIDDTTVCISNLRAQILSNDETAEISQPENIGDYYAKAPTIAFESDGTTQSALGRWMFEYLRDARVASRTTLVSSAGTCTGFDADLGNNEDGRLVCVRLREPATGVVATKLKSDFIPDPDPLTTPNPSEAGSLGKSCKNEGANTICLPPGHSDTIDREIVYGENKCNEGYICWSSKAGSEPTPTPQETCAGEINCQCKEFAPGSDKLDEIIGKGTADSIKAVPILGGVFGSIDNSLAAVFTQFGLGVSGVPSDYAGEENDMQMLAKYYTGCVENAICAETRDIGKIVGSDQTIVGENICIARSQWGQYLRDKKVVVASAKQIPVAKGEKNLLQKLLVAAETEEERIGFLGLETAQKGLAGMCFRNIAYASNVTSIFTGAKIPDFIRPGNTTDLDTTSSDAVNQVLTALSSGVVGIAKDVWKSYTVDSPGGTILRLFAWARDPFYQSATTYTQSLMENGDVEILAQECQKEHNYQIKAIEDMGIAAVDASVKIPKACKTTPEGDTMKDFLKALDDDRLYDIGIPREKIAGVKSSLGECLDCAQTGGLATAIGCVPVLNLQKFITETIFGIGISFAGAFSVLCMIYGAILFQTSAGNSTQVEKGRKLIVNCLVGLIVIVFSLFILKFIGIDLLRIPGLG